MPKKQPNDGYFTIINPYKKLKRKESLSDLNNLLVWDIEWNTADKLFADIFKINDIANIQKMRWNVVGDNPQNVSSYENLIEIYRGLKKITEELFMVSSNEKEFNIIKNINANIIVSCANVLLGYSVEDKKITVAPNGLYDQWQLQLGMTLSTLRPKDLKKCKFCGRILFAKTFCSITCSNNFRNKLPHVKKQKNDYSKEFPS